MINDFWELDVWKKAHEVSLKIFKLTKDFPKEEKYGLAAQLRRSVSSIAANIAEGFDRFHVNDKIRFYYHSRGSLSESKNHIFLAVDLGYINAGDKAELINELSLIGRQINSMINSLRAHSNSRQAPSP